MSIIVATIALPAILLCQLPGEPAPVAEKPTQSQLQTQFDQAEAVLGATAEKTKERADAAKKAMKIASDIAWLAFDAGKYEEAANWFAKSAELKAESHVNARAYWEEYRRTVVAQTEAGLAARIKEFQTQLATAEESKKGALRTSIDALQKIRYTMSYTAISMLETVASENGATADLVEYGKQEVEILHRDLAYLQESAAAKQDIDLKNAQIATALERTAGAQADMASFEAAQENYLTALAIRRALPEEMAERKLEDTLSAFGRMYLYNLGDLIKARDYLQKALASMEASAPARQKALANDPWTPAQKEGMTPEQLARHQESLAQTRDLIIANDTISQCTVLANLGNVAQESGDFKTALFFYERALELVQTLPPGGYLNIFELVRAQIRARALSDIAYLHAESGEVELALKELNETIAIERSIGRDESTAQSLQQAASLAYDTGDNETARHDVEQARQIFAAAQKLQNVVSATDFLAILARDAGQLDEAADHAQEALLLARKTGNIAVLASSARTFASIRLRQNKLPEAKELIDEANRADALSGSVVDKIATLGLAGELLEAEGDNENALEAYQEAVKLLESVRATAASETAFADVKRNYRAYERIVRILIKLNRPDEAFDYLNRAKSKKLHDSLELSSMKSGDQSIQAIAKFFPETEVLLGVQATKAALSAGQRLNNRVVHFATHGILDATRPSQSYILLASGETPGQERLTEGEVLDLPFNKVDLVTLSACETALGDKDPDGGEITSLAEAFSSAGATAVLASLWSVSDESTKEFMIQFYTQLAAGQSKAASLQSAEIALMKNPKFSQPFYWAPFVLMGDWR